MAPAQAYSDTHGGVALLVWKGGKLIYEHYTGGASEASRFETFSMHKSVLGLAYGIAIAQGVIASLDDPAGTYLAEWQNDPRGKITLRQLLTMTSGLHYYGFVQKQALEIAAGTHVTDVALATPLDRPPGTRFEYNNVNSQIAGTILSRALEKSGHGDYAQFISRVLLKPLGAGDAYLWLEHDGGLPRFYAHLQMSARDWLRFGILIDRNGKFDGMQVVPAAWIQSMETPSSLNPNYGIQVWLGTPWVRWRAYGPTTPVRVSHKEPFLTKDLVYFDGFGGERVYVSSSNDLVIVRIGQPRFDFDDSVIPNDVMRAGGS